MPSLNLAPQLLEKMVVSTYLATLRCGKLPMSFLHVMEISW